MAWDIESSLLEAFIKTTAFSPEQMRLLSSQHCSIRQKGFSYLLPCNTQSWEVAVAANAFGGRAAQMGRCCSCWGQCPPCSPQEGQQRGRPGEPGFLGRQGFNCDNSTPCQSRDVARDCIWQKLLPEKGGQGVTKHGSCYSGDVKCDTRHS